jgi:prepilin signal peptidase PulO-like enzyme (type II secretory pathway)
MGRPAKFRFFTCPSCAALYQVVRAEAGPETEVSELACPVCGGPLAPRDGKFILKYFLLREGRRKCG